MTRYTIKNRESSDSLIVTGYDLLTAISMALEISTDATRFFRKNNRDLFYVDVVDMDYQIYYIKVTKHKITLTEVMIRGKGVQYAPQL